MMAATSPKKMQSSHPRYTFWPSTGRSVSSLFAEQLLQWLRQWVQESVYVRGAMVGSLDGLVYAAYLPGMEDMDADLFCARMALLFSTGECHASDAYTDVCRQVVVRGDKHITVLQRVDRERFLVLLLAQEAIMGLALLEAQNAAQSLRAMLRPAMAR